MDPSIARKLAGRFVVIDGPDGAGKGTQIRRLMDGLAVAGVSAISVYDPGDTRAGDVIRQLLLSHNGLQVSIRTETLLFMASRAQLVAEKITPALASGKAVICDRFISATCAYQGANGVSTKDIIKLGKFAVGDCWPDLTIILDLPAEEGLRRIAETRKTAADTMESRGLAFHRRVRKIFRSLPGEYPGKVKIVNAAADAATVHDRLLRAISRKQERIQGSAGTAL